jgi:hypothetical protein
LAKQDFQRDNRLTRVDIMAILRQVEQAGAISGGYMGTAMAQITGHTGTSFNGLLRTSDF